MNQRIVCMLLIACALPACNRKAEGQTVAVVNNQEITAAELNAELSNSNPTSGDAKAARATALQALINRKLLVEQAQSDGLDKSPEFLNQQRRMNDELLINMLISRRLKTAKVPTTEEISRYEASRPEMFANREVWTLDQVLYPLPKDPAVNAKLGAAKSLDEVVQVLTASGIQYKKETKKIDTALFPHQIYAQIANLPSGEPFIAPGATAAVASVITAREPTPTSADQASQIAVNQMKREQGQQILADRVKSLRATAKIEYQPGFEPPKK
jgi:EpsD family peptidyl-prolyl cis-trans isomerase